MFVKLLNNIHIHSHVKVLSEEKPMFLGHNRNFFLASNHLVTAIKYFIIYIVAAKHFVDSTIVHCHFNKNV